MAGAALAEWLVEYDHRTDVLSGAEGRAVSRNRSLGVAPRGDRERQKLWRSVRLSQPDKKGAEGWRRERKLNVAPGECGGSCRG